MPVFDDDPWGPIKDEKGPVSASPREVALFHARSDCDSNQLAQHHTIGVKHDQATAGDHTHDGAGSRKIASGQGLIITGSRASGAALASLLSALSKVMDFTDSTTP